MSLLRSIVPASLLALTLAGCVVEERGYARPPPPCHGAFWVEGHYGPRGVWHPGHWRCPGMVEVVEVE
jgi:hypothetical protein